VRLKGVRNSNYDARRQLLLGAIRKELKSGGARRPTLRELAKACDCSVSTLKHYLGRREDIIESVFAEAHQRAAGHLAEIGRTDLPFEDSIRTVVQAAWVVLADFGAARTLAMGLFEGLGSPRLGACYLSNMFDPFIVALGQRFSLHIARGEMRDVDTRMAALALASPLLLAALHQNELQGDTVFPLSCDAFVEHLVAAFVRAYGCDQPAQGRRTMPLPGDEREMS
jgi:TetR/AcrR family transcriptional regulator, mexJK operon transcriptional repressor